MLLIIGCDSGVDARGFQLHTFFPQDGHRAAVYVQQGTAWARTVEKADTPEARDGDEAWTWTHAREDDGAPLGALVWSSDAVHGIRVHAWAVGDRDLEVLDPPVQVSPVGDRMEVGEVVESGAWTSTLVGFETCPVAWGIDDWNCAHLALEGDLWFAGDWWLAQDQGVAWMRLQGDEERWDLAEYDVD